MKVELDYIEGLGYIFRFEDQKSAQLFAEWVNQMVEQTIDAGPTQPPPAPHNPGYYIAKEKPETSYDVIELWNWYKVWLAVIIILALGFAIAALVSAT